MALDVLSATRRGRRLDLAFSDISRRRKLEPSERRFTRELTYGTIRWRGRLDFLLALRLHKGLKSVAPAVLDVLRLGAYQLLHMDGVPSYAAVSQAVDQARQAGGRPAANLTNAVLRAVGEAGDDPSLFPDPADAPLAWLSAWGSHPTWLIERWLVRWSFEDVRALVEANNRVPPLILLPLTESPGEAIRRLGALGIEGRRVEGAPDSVELPPGSDLEGALMALPAIVQDPGASAVARYADPPAQGVVADLCAAPGGKALAMSRAGCTVVAADASRSRLRLVRENVRRTGASVMLYRGRAERPALRAVDLLLLDVPCTGTGTLRRHPDARWRLRESDLSKLVGVQHEILLGSADVVSSGGVLVYSTCSLEPEENRGRVEAFLRQRPDFCLDKGTDVGSETVTADGYLEVLPQKTGFDGAFAARLRRVG